MFWVIFLMQYDALPKEPGGIFLNIGRQDVLYPSKFILLLSSYIKSSVKIRKPVPETLILPFYFWCWSEVCILPCSIYNSVSKSLRTVDCPSITPAFWKLLVILQTCLLGFIFTAFMICLSSTTVVFSADQVVVGCWWFSNS